MLYMVTLWRGNETKNAIVSAWHMEEARAIASARFPGWTITEVR